MQLISADHYAYFLDAVTEVHRLRYHVFKERLDWDVQFSGDMEIDEFDTLHPAYLNQRARDNRVQGCVHLLPSTGPTMLRDTFPVLLDGAAAPSSPVIWESSRFALDLHPDTPKATHGLAPATYMDRDSKSKNGPLRSLASAVDLVHLRYAAATADHGSFRRAAEAPLLRQSTLSRSVRQLEERIEIIVFERSSGGVRATLAGRNFLRMARSIPEQMDTLVASAHSTVRSEAGRLATGFYTSLSGAPLIDHAHRFPRVERTVACKRYCKAATRRFSSTPEVERQGAVDERSAAPTTRRNGSSEYRSREHMRCGG